MKKLLLALWLIPTTIFSQEITFGSNEEKIAFCKVLVEQMSQVMPIRGDKISLLNSVTCSPTTPPTFIYDNIIELDSDLYSAELLASIAMNNTEQKNLWCTDPEKRMFLENYRIQHRYRDIKGVFLNVREFTPDECN